MEKEEEAESKAILDAIGELNDTKKPLRSGQWYGYAQGTVEEIKHEECILRLKQKQEQMNRLEQRLEQQRRQNQLERKANEIYTEWFGRVEEWARRFCNWEGEGVEGAMDKVEEWLNGAIRTQIHHESQTVIQNLEGKVRELRAQLLKSSQNNINAIFNTEITEASCLQLQIKKMNAEIATLKEGLIQASKHQHYLPVTNSTVRAFTKFDRENWEGETKNRKKSYRKGGRSQSGESSKSGKSGKGSELRLGQVIEGYKSLQGQYRVLQGAIGRLSAAQTDFKQLFGNLRKQITFSIQNQLRQIQISIEREQVDGKQVRVVRQLEIKLGNLINTLNAPQRLSTERAEQDLPDSQGSVNVEYLRKVSHLEASNARLMGELRAVQRQKRVIEERMVASEEEWQKQRSRLNLGQGQQIRVEDGSLIHELRIQNRKKQQDFLLLSSPSQQREQQIVQQLSGSGRSEGVHGVGRVVSSLSDHQGRRGSEVECLYQQLQSCQQALREKELRIKQLENTIMDHIQSRTYSQGGQGGQIVREKYETYIGNLKLLLGEARRENERLKKDFIRTTEMSLSRTHNDDRRSDALSDRTTKNHLGPAQTRLLERRPPVRPLNSFQRIKLALQVEESLEKAVRALLELVQRAGGLGERGVIGAGMESINLLLSWMRTEGGRVWQEVILVELRGRLIGLGIRLQ